MPSSDPVQREGGSNSPYRHTMSYNIIITLLKLKFQCEVGCQILENHDHMEKSNTTEITALLYMNQFLEKRKIPTYNK